MTGLAKYCCRPGNWDPFAAGMLPGFSCGGSVLYSVSVLATLKRFGSFRGGGKGACVLSPDVSSVPIVCLCVLPVAAADEFCSPPEDIASPSCPSCAATTAEAEKDADTADSVSRELKGGRGCFYAILQPLPKVSASSIPGSASLFVREKSTCHLPGSSLSFG